MKVSKFGIDPLEVLRIVSEYYKVPIEDITGNCRKKDIKIARHVARFLIRFNTTLTVNEIASLMIGRKKLGNDHSTIVHSCKAVTDWLETDEDFNAEVQEIQSHIMEFKNKIIQQLRDEMTQRRIAALEGFKKEIPPTSIKHARVVDMSEHEKLIAKYV